MRTFPIWRTVTLGTFRSTNAIRRALIAGGYYRYIDDEDEDRKYEYRPARSDDELDPCFEEVLARIPLAPRRTTVDLVRCTLPELGFDGLITDSGAYEGFRPGQTNTFHHEIIKRAWWRGYLCCPPEVALQLRLQYSRQPIGERINIGMEPFLTPENGYPVILQVWRDGCGKFVDVCDTTEMKHGFISARDFWVFVKPRAP